MLTKDPVNDTHAHFLEQSEETTVKNSPSFRELSRSLLYSLPKHVQKKIQDNLFGVLDAHQVSQFRDDKRCQFWINQNGWKRVPYSQFRHVYSRIALYPKSATISKIHSSEAASNATSADLRDQQARLLQSNGFEGQPNRIDQHITYTRRVIRPTATQQFQPTLALYKPVANSKVELKASHQVRQNFTTHVLQASETVEMLAQQYTGYKNANLIYDYNLGFSRAKPAPVGTGLIVPNGWKLNIEGSCSNCRSIDIVWQGPTNGQITLQLEKKRPDEISFWQHYFVVKPGVYAVTVTASGLVETTSFTVLQPTQEYEIELLDQAGNPQANMGYKIRLRNGHVVSGVLDSKGYAHVSGPDFENAKISFHELDDKDWQVASPSRNE
ncbi:MAG: hypothetical protein HRU18_06985 [Pseudoalteromonas sp.]|uniref:hypothetical protein n=1 Tax=Pseudoalteromonas sp. TaxID=53249 RepID=UPI001DA3CC60|nr:hypothetical protein [Pseudoalteromonas sp.]NRA77936.1 hypothetical protein [Pseudoalteromonas sp.]